MSEPQDAASESIRQSSGPATDGRSLPPMMFGHSGADPALPVGGSNHERAAGRGERINTSEFWPVATAGNLESDR